MEDIVKIPIKNIYYLLCYAWDIAIYNVDKSCGSEEFSNIYNLLGRMLCDDVDTLIKRGFYKGYIDQVESTSRLKGQINISDSINQMTILKKQMICCYDDYSSNVLFNQIIKSTLIDFLKVPYLDKDICKKIKKLICYFDDVNYIYVTNRIFYSLRFNRNNRNYQRIINVCKLFRFGLIANENGNDFKFLGFIEENYMNKIYEKFILNFYNHHLDHKKYRVHAPNVEWKLDKNIVNNLDDYFFIEEEPGNRRTDIVIENKIDNIELTLDAKYYKDMLVKKYMSDGKMTYRTSHLNQVRGYVLDSKFNGQKYGGLIYPTVNENEKYEKGMLIPISGSYIIIKSLNLNQEWCDIEKDLVSFAANIIK